MECGALVAKLVSHRPTRATPEAGTATPASAFPVIEGDAKHKHATQNLVVFTHGQP